MKLIAITNVKLNKKKAIYSIAHFIIILNDGRKMPPVKMQEAVTNRETLIRSDVHLNYHQ